MDFLIDKQTWQKVIMKLPPETSLIVKRGLKTDLNGWESKIKKEFVLELSVEKINFGFFIKNCVNNRHLTYDSQKIINIEKAIIEVLIETKGLPREVIYNDKSNPLPKRNEKYVDFKIFNFLFFVSGTVAIVQTLSLIFNWPAIVLIIAILINVIWFLFSVDAL